MSTPLALWIVGEPGVGKTTLARTLLEPGSEILASPKWTIGERVVLAGHYTGNTFDGADTVAYNGAAAALSYWEESLSSKPLTVFDGDRFSNAGALERVRLRARPVCVWMLASGVNIVEARRIARGSNQNPTWVKGRITKSKNFAALFPPAATLILNGTAPVTDLSKHLRKFIESAQ